MNNAAQTERAGENTSVGEKERRVEETTFWNDLKQDFQVMFKDMHVFMSAEPIPYAGENDQYYLTVQGNRFPLREANERISARQLQKTLEQVQATLSADTSAEDRAEVVSVLLHALKEGGVQDQELRSNILELLFTPDTLEAAQTQTIFEFPLNLADGQVDSSGRDGLVYRNILRTGRWAVSPKNNLPWNDEKDGLVVTRDRLDMLKANFDAGAIEYVMVPDTHNPDQSLVNKGFIRQLDVTEDPDRPGEHVLRAGFDFTSDEAKKAVLEGSVAGVSCGIKFDYTRRQDGKTFPAVLHHVALTNQPWIDGLGGWDVLAAAEYEVDHVVLAGTEEKPDMTETTNEKVETQTDAASEAELAQLREEIATLRAEKMRQEVAAEMQKLQTEKKILPAVLKKAEPILLSAKKDETKTMCLADDGKEQESGLYEALLDLLGSLPEGADLENPQDTAGNAVAGDQSPPPTTVAHEQKVAELLKELGREPVPAESVN